MGGYSREKLVIYFTNVLFLFLINVNMHRRNIFLIEITMMSFIEWKETLTSKKLVGIELISQISNNSFIKMS